MKISIFKNIYQSKDGEETSISEFLNNVKFGTWKHLANEINETKTKEEKQEAKKKLPYITPSGFFQQRKASELIEHSGFICIDIDDLKDADAAKERLKSDPYFYAIFKSISGNGLAILIKIQPTRHLDAFFALESYFAERYNLFIDKSCKDTSRARFVSYDPQIYINDKSLTFKKYLEKRHDVHKSKLPNLIIGKKDIDLILEQIQSQSIDLTDSNYEKYLRIGFALASEFQESGREIYHTIAQFSPKYDRQKCDKQFDHCIKNGRQGINFSTFLFYCKEANISIISDQTKHIVSAAKIAKSGGRGIGEIISTLKEIDNIDESESHDIVKQVYDREDIGGGNELDIIEQLELFMSSNYNVRFNEITSCNEEKGKKLNKRDYNSIFIKAKKEVDKTVRFDDLERLIESDFTESFNPLHEFLEKNKNIETCVNNDNVPSLIATLASAITTDNQDVEIFLRKWLVGLIQLAYGQPCPLLLVFAGPQKSGKTEFFRRLLPDELKTFYSESKLDAGKDDEILMCEKWILMDDEFGGKSKQENKRLKELTSKDIFSLRRPYGRYNEDIKRLAGLCGTTNDKKILSDPTGNRRIIPIHIEWIDRKLYNSIDKKTLLIEAYHLWEQGFDINLNEEEQRKLNHFGQEFENLSVERELFIKYYKMPEEGDEVKFMQISEIKAKIERISQQKLNIIKLFQEAEKIGFQDTKMVMNGSNVRGFHVVEMFEESMNVVKPFSGDETKSFYEVDKDDFPKKVVGDFLDS